MSKVKPNFRHSLAPPAEDSEFFAPREDEQAIEDAVLRAVHPDEWYRPNKGGAAVKPVSVIGDAGPLSTRLDTPSGSGPEFGMTYIELCLREDRNRHVSEIREAVAKLRELSPLWDMYKDGVDLSRVEWVAH